MKRILFPAFAMGLGAVLFLLVLEVIARFLPVCEDLHILPVDNQNPVVRFEPDRDVTWSRFPTFSMVNTVHMNNYGFINDADYFPDDPRPLVAVIGDSYVEAVMVPFPDTGHGRMARKLEGKARVYSFGSSGSPLSQYLAYATYVMSTFGPEKMIFVVVGNDFDESLIEYKSSPPFHYFTRDAGGVLRLVRIDWSPSLEFQLARKSRLALYLLNNAEIRTFPNRLARSLNMFRGSVEESVYAGHTAASWDRARLEGSRQAVDFFLEQLLLKTGLDPGNILFVVDGMREQIYSGKVTEESSESYFALMRQYFMQRADEKRFQVVDMHPAFENRYRENGRRFEYEEDGHWNSHGHKEFFLAVSNSTFLDEYQ